jgi:LynF/TruF/PatF family peptide O-prenyltransferase
MIVSGSTSSSSEQSLRYFSEHKRAFDVENFYSLDCFESFLKAQCRSTIDCACKVDFDRLHAARFTLGFNAQPDGPNLQRKIADAFRFFKKVEARVGANLNYQLLQQLLDRDFNFSQVSKIFVGIDARAEVLESRLKLFVWLENYPDKVETAIDLCKYQSDEANVRALILNNSLLVGFDFYLNGKANVEIYPTLNRVEFLRPDIRAQLLQLLPSQALPLLEMCYALQIGFSQANDSKILYFHPLDPGDFINLLGNEMAKKVQAYYQHQPIKALVVCIPEAELLNHSINRLNLYYNLN